MSYIRHRSEGFIVFLLHFRIRFMVMSTKREVVVWKKWHEEIFWTEVSIVEPHKFKVGRLGGKCQAIRMR